MFSMEVLMHHHMFTSLFIGVFYVGFLALFVYIAYLIIKALKIYIKNNENKENS